MTVYFTSDHHFGHANIIKYSNRPFASADEMNQALVERWNGVVAAGDLVYVLGDFSFQDPGVATDVVRQLNGSKYLIWGNHDKHLRKSTAFMREFVWCKDLHQIQVEDQKIVLCHYAMLTWNQSHRGSWMLHGHSHGTLPEDPNALRIDVGVDAWDYYPVSFAEIREKMSKKTFKPIDHHDRPI